MLNNETFQITEVFFFDFSDEDEVAKLLLDRGAKINTLNGKGATPLIIAAVKGHYSVLRILANHPSIQLHEQVGRTYYLPSIQRRLVMIFAEWAFIYRAPYAMYYFC